MMKAVPQTPALQTRIPTRVQAQARPPAQTQVRPIPIPTHLQAATQAVKISADRLKNVRQRMTNPRKQTLKKASRINCKNIWRKLKNDEDGEVENEEFIVLQKYDQKRTRIKCWIGWSLFCKCLRSFCFR